MNNVLINKKLVSFYHLELSKKLQNEYEKI